MISFTYFAKALRSLCALLAGALVLAGCNPNHVSELEAGVEPRAVIITTPVGEESDEDLSGLIAGWAQNPTVTEVLHIRNEASDTGKFGDLIAIAFNSEAAHNAWVEKEIGKIGDTARARSAIVLTHGEITPRDPQNAIFKVNDYQPIVSAEKYDAFADGYIRPLMEGQVAAKLMTRYTTYFEEGEDGLVWSIYEYADKGALESAGAVKEGIRANLTETNATYREFHPVKDDLRVGGGETYGKTVTHQ